MRPSTFGCLALAALCLGCPQPHGDDAGRPDSGTDAGHPPVADAGRPDAGPACSLGLSPCLGTCLDLTSSREHCGACGHACDAQRICSGSRCVLDCTGDYLECDNACTNVRVDPMHCGDCATQCRATETCTAGACRARPGFAECDGAVVDTLTNPAHCGGCGRACATGNCTAGVCCDVGQANCGGACIDTRTDPNHCGGCGRLCGSSQVCESAACVNCGFGQSACDNACVDLQTSPEHCGMCGRQCASGQTCELGMCGCARVLTDCSGTCVDTQSTPQHCGACGQPCAAGQLCIAGACVASCPSPALSCGLLCVDATSSSASCGGCGTRCAAAQACTASSCVACPSGPTADCDGDGYTVGDGDCCDSPGACSATPELVNPGAVELANNFVDDNCNGLLDGADVIDLSACDSALASNTSSAVEAAAALDICRLTTAGATGALKTWGLISAEWQLVDGTPLQFHDAHSVRGSFGTGWSPRLGAKMLLISSGVAADSSQTMPGPNDGPAFTQSALHGSEVVLTSCDAGSCLGDWFAAANLPVKQALQLPESPVCPTGAATEPEVARDSVMLVLKLRAPTNARSFTLRSAFFSVEYPEYVCSDYNDQLVVAIDTPTPTWPLPNPPDKNLLTYRDGPLSYPVGINVAAGASIFEVCETPLRNASCQDSLVSPRSCSAGTALLAGTGFESSFIGDCAQGGATRWLTVHGNVQPGREVTLRLAIWDVGDDAYDSTALLDAFRWQINAARPGTE